MKTHCRDESLLSHTNQRSLHIGLNLLYLIPGHVGGTQTYAEELMRALAALDTPDTYTVYLNEEARELPLPASFQRVVCPVHAVRRTARYAFEQLRLPELLRRHGIDLIHSPGYVCPLRVSCHNVVTICDLNYIALRDAMSRSKRVLLGRFVRQSACKADHILTLSEFSRDQILHHLNVSPNKVTSVHLGPRPNIGATSNTLRAEVMRRYGISTPYVVAFSSLLRHKNIPRLLEAFAEVADDLPYRLVLVGHMPDGVEIRTEIARLGLGERVTITGYVPGAHIMPLLEQAELFVFPSLYEGFGLPVLDAQQAGVAVVCSREASLPEIAGDGALFFDPNSIDAIADALRRGMRDRSLRHTLVEKGRVNLTRFSWEQTARQTLAIYRATAARSDHDAQARLQRRPA